MVGWELEGEYGNIKKIWSTALPLRSQEVTEVPERPESARPGSICGGIVGVTPMYWVSPRYPPRYPSG